MPLSQGAAVLSWRPCHYHLEAQFLNVIELVFSGMSRAIIHSSNYPSLDDAETAINRYFDERNDYFQKHPHRAGKKIWGKEREPATFSEFE